MAAEKNNLRWWILLTVIIGTLLGRLDQTIVNLALPKIIQDFSITVSEAGWIATAYILANAVFVPVWGKLGDTVGRKKIYIMGFALFILGSVLAGLSWDLSSLLVFRIIQAIASSADYPTAMAIIAVTFREQKERAQALGLWSSAFAASAVLGHLIGGPLIDNFGWRSIFLVNLPIGLLGLAMALVFVKESVSEKPTVNFDIGGALALGGALSVLVLVLDRGLEWGWFSITSIACYIGVLAFLVLLYKIDSKHPEPIIDFRFFKNFAFLAVLANNFIVFLGMIVGIFLIPLFAQTYMGLNATETGYLFIPMAFGLMIAAPLGASFIGKVKPKNIIFISTLIAAAGMFMFINLDPRSNSLGVIIPVTIMAFGIGFGMSQRTTAITNLVPTEEIGVASSILALVRNIAGAFGIALAATILQNSIETNVLNIASNSTINSASPQVFAQVVGLIIAKAQIMAYHSVFIVAAAILLIGAVLALYINVEDKKTKMPIMIE